MSIPYGLGWPVWFSFIFPHVGNRACLDGEIVKRLRISPVDEFLLRSVGRSGVWGVVYSMATTGGVIVGLLVPVSLAAAVDSVVAGAGYTHVARFSLLVLVAVGAGAVAGVAGAMCSTRITASLRLELAEKTLDLRLSERAVFATGDLASRLVASTQEAAGTVLGAITVLTTLVTAVFAVGALWLLDWMLVVTLLAVAPLTILVTRRLVSHSSHLFAQYQALQGRLSALLTEALSGIRTIRAAGTVNQETVRVLHPVEELSRTGRELWRVQQGSVWQFSTVMMVAELVVMAAAGWGVAQGRLSPGQFLAASSYAGMVLGALGQVDAIMEIAHGREGARRVLEILGSRQSKTSDNRGLSPGRGEVALEGIRVCHGDQTVLDSVDLVIPPGAMVAVVGTSGAGKSTLAQLVGGLVAPEAGSVRIDGCDVDTLSMNALREAVAYAFERPFLLGTTVRDAIAYGTRPAAGCSVEDAARAVHADEFIRRLPDGYDTVLARVSLSGGEAQRLGLARALFAEARVLVLDDATSSLDTVTEQQVTDTMTHALVGRTRLVIAHRASTAARADLVAWLDQGRVRALAPHTVLREDPNYRALFGHGGQGAPIEHFTGPKPVQQLRPAEGTDI
ncbi:ABC transporter ATP-binding protein [Streptomyces wedmorensis]